MARDGWSFSNGSGLAGSLDAAWLCPACCERSAGKQPGLAKSGPLQPAPASKRPRTRSKLRILLIDDEDMVRRCTARSLSDFEVISVSGALEALALLETDSDFDAVLSDVMMPRLSGPQLYARCFELYPLLARRFVFSSGNPEAARTELTAVLERVGAEQAPILLAKPSSRESLLLAIFAAASQSMPRSGMWSVAEEAPLEVTKYRG